MDSCGNQLANYSHLTAFLNQSDLDLLNNLQADPQLLSFPTLYSLYLTPIMSGVLVNFLLLFAIYKINRRKPPMYVWSEGADQRISLTPGDKSGNKHFMFVMSIAIGNIIFCLIYGSLELHFKTGKVHALRDFFGWNGAKWICYGVPTAMEVLVVTNLTAVAIERYVVTVRVLQSISCWTVSRCRLIIVSTWILAVSLGIGYGFMWNVHCVSMPFPVIFIRIPELSYKKVFYFRLAGLFLTPFLVMSVCYFAVIKELGGRTQNSSTISRKVSSMASSRRVTLAPFRRPARRSTIGDLLFKTREADAMFGSRIWFRRFFSAHLNTTYSNHHPPGCYSASIAQNDTPGITAAPRRPTVSTDVDQAFDEHINSRIDIEEATSLLLSRQRSISEASGGKNSNNKTYTDTVSASTSFFNSIKTFVNGKKQSNETNKTKNQIKQLNVQSDIAHRVPPVEANVASFMDQNSHSDPEKEAGDSVSHISWAVSKYYNDLQYIDEGCRITKEFHGQQKCPIATPDTDNDEFCSPTFGELFDKKSYTNRLLSFILARRFISARLPCCITRDTFKKSNKDRRINDNTSKLNIMNNKFDDHSSYIDKNNNKNNNNNINTINGDNNAHTNENLYSTDENSTINSNSCRTNNINIHDTCKHETTNNLCQDRSPRRCSQASVSYSYPMNCSTQEGGKTIRRIETNMNSDLNTNSIGFSVADPGTKRIIHSTVDSLPKQTLLYLPLPKKRNHIYKKYSCDTQSPVMENQAGRRVTENEILDLPCLYVQPYRAVKPAQSLILPTNSSHVAGSETLSKHSVSMLHFHRRGRNLSVGNNSKCSQTSYFNPHTGSETTSTRFVPINQKRRRVMKLLGLVWLVFLVCWLPRLCLDVYRTQLMSTDDLKPTAMLDIVTELIMLWWPCLDACLFFQFSNRLRTELWGTVMSIKRAMTANCLRCIRIA